MTNNWSRRVGAAVVVIGLVTAGCTAARSSSPGRVVSTTSGATTAVPPPGGAVPSSAHRGTGSTTATAASTTAAASATPTVARPPQAVVAASPAFGAKELSPSAPIVIRVAKGRISSLSFTNPAGKKVKGSVSADGSTWTLGEVLGFGKTYTATGMVTGTDGKTVTVKGTFSTLGSGVEADSYISPGDGATVGIAQSVMILFPTEPTDRAAVERALTIKTTPAVEGSWGWIHHDGGWGIDWRTKDYWPAGTKVHVEAKLYGLKLAPGVYGSSDLSSDFTIGRAQVVYADAEAHQIVVKQGCTHINDPESCSSTSATYPASFGSATIANNVTRSGIHVVVRKDQQVTMRGTPPAHYTSTEYWAVRISDNGEFIHENPNTVSDQGNTNVSNGCINLSAASAEAYFNTALVGDPVEVTGTDIALSAADGDLFDWTIPWSKWQTLGAN